MTSLTFDLNRLRFGWAVLALVTVGVTLFLIGGTLIQARSFVVDSLGDEPDANIFDGDCKTAGGACTLRAAVEQANTSLGEDSISFRDDLFLTPPAFLYLENGSLEIREAVSIQGPGADLLTIDAQADSRHFTIRLVDGTVRISNLTLTNGWTAEDDPNGGAVLFTKRPAYYYYYYTPTPGIPQLELDLSDMVIGASTAAADGGAIHAANSDSVGSASLILTLERVSLESNLADGDGGAIWTGRDTGLFVYSSTLAGNQARDGGALYLSDPAKSAKDGVVYVNDNNLYVANRAFRNGGAVYMAATSSTTGSQFLDNVADAQGGAIHVSSGNLNVNRTTFNGNQAGSDGGALSVDVISGQVTEINQSTLSANLAGSDGGGIYATGGGGSSQLTLTGSTITDNTAQSGRGGGLAVAADADVGSPLVSVGTSILAGNTATNFGATADCYHTIPSRFTSAGYNLTGNNTTDGCTPGGSDIQVAPGQVFTTVLDRQLRDNGGPTLTHALLPTSPAIDRIPPGTNGCGTDFTSDQRGVPRPLGSGCDIGAYEATRSAIDVTKTVSVEPKSCGTTASLGVRATVSQTVNLSYCVTIANTGNISLTTYAISDPTLGVDTTGTMILPPGSTREFFPFPYSDYDGTGDLDNTVTIMATNDSLESIGVSTTITDSASAEVFPMTIDLVVEDIHTGYVATRTVTATVYRVSAGEELPLDGQRVGFEVTGGTVEDPSFKTSGEDGAGQAVFEYISRAPEPTVATAGFAAMDPQDTDTIYVWVDVNGNGIRDPNQEPYEPYMLCTAPTAITLASFSALSHQDGNVLLQWQTAVEIDSAGFHVQRASAVDGPYARVTRELIPAVGMGGGASYSYVDTPPARGAYYYLLEEVDVNGVSTLHGPVSVDFVPGSRTLYFPQILLR